MREELGGDADRRGHRTVEGVRLVKLTKVDECVGGKTKDGGGGGGGGGGRGGGDGGRGGESGLVV